MFLVPIWVIVKMKPFDSESYLRQNKVLVTILAWWVVGRLDSR